MSCAMLALLDQGIKVDKYVAYEIDKYAVKTATHNFPEIEQRGDVFDADFTEFRNFDYLMGGSPCTYWSIAQKNNRETEASGLGWELFSQYVRALKEAQPKYFIYENNKSMSNAIRQSITETFGFEPICINSALLSAQNRQRLYWVGKRNADGTYSKVEIQQPVDKGILLKDILDNAKISAPIGTTSNGSSFCLTARYHKGVGTNPGKVLDKHKDSMAAEPVNTTMNGKSRTIKAQYYKNGVANFITNNGFGASAVAVKVGYAEPCEWDENNIPVKAMSYADGKTYQVYEVKRGFITIKSKEYPIKLADGYYIIRKLTVRECMRLQTVPEWYDFSVVSDTQAYKMLGNGWTVAVISYLLSHTLE